MSRWDVPDCNCVSGICRSITEEGRERAARGRRKSIRAAGALWARGASCVCPFNKAQDGKQDLVCVWVSGSVGGGWGGGRGLRGSRYGRSIPICIVRRSDLQGGFQKEPIEAVGGGGVEGVEGVGAGRTKRPWRPLEDCWSTCHLLRSRADLPVSSGGVVRLEFLFFSPPVRIHDREFEQ